VIVTFWKFDDGRFSRWQADRGKRRLEPGTIWGDAHTLTHDLAGMVVEATLALPWGFWACVEAGATFSSTGRRRTQPGRGIIRTRRADLQAAEQATHAHTFAWQKGRPTPLAAALDDMWSRWAPLSDYEPLVVEWPTLHAKSVELASMPQRVPRPRQDQRAVGNRGAANVRGSVPK
jgi:hypothetical protein